MLKIDIEFLLRKTMVRLNFKIDLGSLPISPGHPLVDISVLSFFTIQRSRFGAQTKSGPFTKPFFYFRVFQLFLKSSEKFCNPVLKLTSVVTLSSCGGLVH